MGNFRGWEWILILLLALLLFGGFKKLPDAARGVGRSLRIFKAETKGLQDDDASPEPTGELAPGSAEGTAVADGDTASTSAGEPLPSEPKAASTAASDKTSHDSAS
jgi:sec-independent protein translocase protein TatA